MFSTQLITKSAFNSIKMLILYLLISLKNRGSISMNKKAKKAQNRIKIVLAQRSKSNKWLAEQLNVNEPTVSLWCRNKTQPALETFYLIADLLDIEVRKLLVPTKESDE